MTAALTAPLSQIVLSPGSAMTVAGLTWQHYQLFLAELGDDRAARLAYGDGTLEIRMPSQLHEIVNRLLSKIIFTLVEELEREVVDLGSMTWNREDLSKGIEPDSCFYIQNAGRVPGLNPEIPADLPPDLVIEVDIARASAWKRELYRTLGVPELWVYGKGRVEIWDLQGEKMAAVERRLAFPDLSSAQLQAWIARRETETDLTIVKAVRQCCQDRKQ